MPRKRRDLEEEPRNEQTEDSPPLDAGYPAEEPEEPAELEPGEAEPLEEPAEDDETTGSHQAWWRGEEGAAFWADTAPIFKQLVNEGVDERLEAHKNELLAGVKSLLEQTTPNVPKLVSDAVDQKLNGLMEQVQELAPGLLGGLGQGASTSLSGSPGEAAEQVGPQSAPANRNNGNWRNSLLEQLAPMFIQQLMGKPQQAQNPFASLDAMSQLAGAMGTAFQSFASPILEAQQTGYQRAYQEMGILARFGVNPFDSGNGNGNGHATGSEGTPAN